MRWLFMSNLIRIYTVCIGIFPDQQGNSGDRIHILQSTLVISTRLTQTTAYLEVKICPLLSHENLTASHKILWKRGEILLFPTIFLIYL